MPFSHIVTTSVQSPSGNLARSATYSASLEANIDEPTLAIGTNTPIAIILDVSVLKSLVISSSTACTIKTNSTTVPGDTLTFAAGEQKQWNTDSYGAPLLAVDVTIIYVTNAAQTNLQLRAIQDATP